MDYSLSALRDLAAATPVILLVLAAGLSLALLWFSWWWLPTRTARRARAAGRDGTVYGWMSIAIGLVFNVACGLGVLAQIGLYASVPREPSPVRRRSGRRKK